MIEVRGLSKYYGEAKAISDLTFDIQRGEIAGFLGLNGAGKSTALKILAGYLLPTSGQVLIDGVNLISEPEQFRASIGFLPEKPPLYDEMTVTAYLSYVARLRKVPRGKLNGRLSQVLGQTGLEDRGGQVIETLSLGYRKRLGIAQAIVHDPALVILDEPISGLDPVQIVQMRDLIRSLGGERTVLISSHILPEVQETCDRLLVLRDGALVAQGTESQLLARSHGARHLEASLVGERGKIEQILKQSQWVESLKRISSLEASVFHVDLVLSTGQAEQLVAELVGQGIGVRRLFQSDNGLEAVFMAVTTGVEGQA